MPNPTTTQPSLYTFTEYTPEWQIAFALEAERLKHILGDELLIAHHIGSTSVPGLAAKPIIDVLPIVRSVEAVDALTGSFESAGYRAHGEYGLSGRRYFTKDRDGYRTHNLHCYQIGNPNIDRHLAFCAYLRSHENSKREYEDMKRTVYARHPADITAYNDGKNAFIKQLEKIALAWYSQRNQAQ